MNNAFIRWYFNEFHSDQLYITMENTVEGSPWHREKNVGIHTDMVVTEYLSLAGELDNDSILGALACAFHDTGKPIACKKNGIKFKPERGEYLSFGGHEPMGARDWENYAATNWSHLKELFPTLVPEDIFKVSWIIESHLPWSIKKDWKLDQMATTAGLITDVEVFTKVLLADTLGRVSDDATEKRAKVRAWISEFKHRMLDLPFHEGVNFEGKPVMYVPIGASGSGKSTYRHNGNVEGFSLDDMRLELYGDDYSEAFRLSCEDNEFKNKATAKFRKMVDDGGSIFLDNTNTSRKGRKQFIDVARRGGYFIEAILFPAPLQVVIDRQLTRTDKTVPPEAVVRQYRGTQMPQYGEVDSIITIDSNLL